MLRVVALTLPLKVMFAASVVSVKFSVAAFNVPLKVVPPVCVNVTTPRSASAPTFPVIETVP